MSALIFVQCTKDQQRGHRDGHDGLHYSLYFARLDKYPKARYYPTVTYKTLVTSKR